MPSDQMTTREALEAVLARGVTKYRIAKDLGASPVSVHQWLRTTRMSKPYAARMEKLYGITITDAV